MFHLMYSESIQVTETPSLAVTVESVVTEYLAQPEEKLECLR